MESLSGSGSFEVQVRRSFLERVQAAVVLIDSGNLSQGLACLDADWLQSPPELAGLAGAYLLQNGLASKAMLPL